MPKEHSKKKISRLDGLFQTRKLHKGKGAPPLETRESNVQNLEILSGSPNSSGVVEFELTAGLNEWVRFTPTPFQIDYNFKVKNQDYQDTPHTGSKTVKTVIPTTHDYVNVKKPYLMANKVLKGHDIFLPPELGMAAYYSHVEVYVNGMKIGDETDMMNQNKIYQGLNRIYCNKERRAMLNQNTVYKGIAQNADEVSFEVIEEADGSTTVKKKTVRSKEQLKLCEKTSMESFEEDFNLTDLFTLDGNFAISPPMNEAMSVLRGQQHSNYSGYFPPGTTLTVRLHPRYPANTMLLKFNDNFYSIYTQASIPESQSLTKKTDVEMHISSLGMIYERIVLPDELSKRQMSRTLNYPFQRCQFDICSFEQGHQQTLNLSRVPPGAKACFLTFVKEEHLWFNASSNKNMMNCFHFPHELHHLSLALTDHGPIVAKTGLSHIDHFDVNYCVELKAYFMDYVWGKGLTDISFDEMFPKVSDGSESLTQSLFVDLQPFYLKDASKLTITCDYKGTHSAPSKLSPKNVKIVVVYILDMNLKRHADNKWTLESII